MKYLLDTHTWIWWNMSPQKLSKKVLSIISQPDSFDEIFLSAISIWEFCKLLEKKKLAVSLNPEEWIEQALEISKLRLIHLTPAISYRSTVLPSPFHNDSADQIIAASARQENAVILSKDSRILNYPHVKTLW